MFKYLRLFFKERVEMKKKILVFIFLSVILLFGIFAAAEEVSPAISDAVAKAGENLGPEVSGFVQDFVSKRDINPEKINSIERVDFNALPKEVNIENVGDNNLAIYQVDYNGTKGSDKVFVVAYSVEKLSAQGDIILAQDKRLFLNFGHSGAMGGSNFLDTAAGVKTNLEKGYIMPRDGSITAISTNLEILKSNSGSVEVIIYINGERVNFGNTIDAGVAGVKNDYDVQSGDTVAFHAGDVISVYINSEGDVSWGDVTTLVEITTKN